LDRLGRLAGHAEITADAEYGPWPQADARDAVVLEIDAGVAFVAALEDAIMRRGDQRDIVAERIPLTPSPSPPEGRGEIMFGWSENRGGAGVDEPLDLPLQLLDRFEYGQRADDVDLRAKNRIGPTHRHLQSREMHDVRDRVRLEHFPQ